MPERLKGVDWAKVRAEYINGSASLHSLAQKYGLSKVTTERRAAREGWTQARKEAQIRAMEKANERITERKADELAELNRADLNIARALRNQIAQHIHMAREMGIPLPANDLRTLAAAAEAVQRVSRLAIGAPTSSTEVTGKDGGPLKAEVSRADAVELLRRLPAEKLSDLEAALARVEDIVGCATASQS